MRDLNSPESYSEEDYEETEEEVDALRPVPFPGGGPDARYAWCEYCGVQGEGRDTSCPMCNKTYPISMAKDRTAAGQRAAKAGRAAAVPPRRGGGEEREREEVARSAAPEAGPSEDIDP